MLLTEEVEVSHGSKTRTYYEELGYYFVVWRSRWICRLQEIQRRIYKYW